MRPVLRTIHQTHGKHIPPGMAYVSFCSYLVAYVVTIEVMTVEKGVQSWKSVRSCSVEVEESTEEPTSLSETVVMTQVGGG